jgi:hypothetical protein
MQFGKNTGERPDLSVIIATPDDNASSVRLVLRTLATQTARKQLEVIVVAPSVDSIDLEDFGPTCFYDLRVIAIGPFHTWAKAMVAGVRDAAAEAVVLAEDHAFLPPDWAAALIEAHRKYPRTAGIGPAMNNANPRSACSRVHLMMDYGLWLDPNPGGALNDIPGHNSSYKRDALLAIDAAALELMMDRSNQLHTELLRRGHELRIAPGAVCFHLNPSKRGISIGMRFNAGRMIGYGRVKHGKWPMWLRLLYVLGSPLLPIMRLRYTLANLRRSRRLGDLLDIRLTLTLVALTLVGVVGEAMGYAFGMEKRTLAFMDTFEFHRYRQMRESDLFAGATCGEETIEIGDIPLRPPTHQTAVAVAAQ